MKIGVCLKSLGAPFRRALAGAQKMGVTGVEIDASGDFAPQALSQSGRRELRHLLRSHNLELTAVNCPLRRGLDVAEHQQQRIDHVQAVLSLSYDLGPRLTVVQGSKVPEKDDLERGQLLKEATSALGRYGDRIGASLALETGADSGAVFGQFLGGFDSASLGASFNAAALLVNGHDPRSALRALGERVIYAHATDARHAGSGKAREVALGHGDLDWMEMLAVLEEIGYRGWLVIEREPGPASFAEVAAGVVFLRRFTGA